MNDRTILSNGPAIRRGRPWLAAARYAWLLLALLPAGCPQPWQWVPLDTYPQGQDVDLTGMIVNYEGTDDLTVLDTGHGQWIVLDLGGSFGPRSVALGWQVRVKGDWDRDHRGRPVVHVYDMHILNKPRPSTQPTTQPVEIPPE